MSSPQTSLAEYSKRMNKVLNYIDAHLDAPLDLNTLAEVAHFSPFHFHRIFSAWMGETLGDYLRRRRLESAAVKLAAQPRLSILSVALSIGFSSGEAFARAFKLQFSCSPSAWQRDTTQRWATELASIKNQNRNLSQVDRNPDQALQHQFDQDGISKLSIKENHMDVKLVELPAAKIAYLRKIGPYGIAVSEFWRTSFYPWLLAQNLGPQPIYGIGLDDPSVTPADKCRYDAGVEVGADYVATGHAMLTTLPGGRYAVSKFVGTVDEISDVWITLFRGWLPSSGLQCDDRPCFEYYPVGSSFDEVTGVFDCELCIPVRPL
ncbi:AraC family transcriptional regulator [Undibacterium sp. GrIS 1.8]|uniref:AraC family transcriptional regulator n=1 Tax=Undibacterium sp. GrIS 1.8 TaxID=3143934 RepID=UPI00339ADB2B